VHFEMGLELVDALGPVEAAAARRRRPAVDAELELGAVLALG